MGNNIVENNEEVQIKPKIEKWEQVRKGQRQIFEPFGSTEQALGRVRAGIRTSLKEGRREQEKTTEHD